MTDSDMVDSLRTPLLADDDEDEEEAQRATQTEETSDPSDDDDDGDDDETMEPSIPVWYKALHTTILPDYSFEIQSDYLVEKTLLIKLIKFVALTFGMIAMIHIFVRSNHHFSGDRDQHLTLVQIWKFEGSLIVSDCIIFFLVGRLWKQRGVDHLAWIFVAILCNVYFESQHFFTWLSHSVTLYEMHCIWPWQLWMFVCFLIPLIGGIVALHAYKAYQDRILSIKFLELAFFGLLYLGPAISSPYFHFHHWFAGWMLGMHCNYNVWWSRAAMAWCWGMYINGIGVYGRDPILTCEYAYFVATDNHCPFVMMEEVEEYSTSSLENHLPPSPADWRNCSSHGYHP